MNLVNLERVSKRHAEKQVLDEVTLGVDDRDRVGVIGANGSGKSTLLRIAAGVEEPDSGRVVQARDLRWRFVPQEPVTNPQDSVLGAALNAPLPPGDDPGAREARARALLHHLGLRAFDRPVGELSGGQRKRLALAGGLVDDVDLLILDEPTNHLDVDVVDWLEDILRSRSGALLLVTHDRYLLDRVATRIVEVHRGGIETAHGSYGDYLEARAVRAEQAAATEQRRRNRARVELAWLRRAPKARTSKARYRVDRAEALLQAPRADEPAALEIGLPARRLGSKVVTLHEVGKRFGDRWVLRHVTHRLEPRARIGIVGPNGAGKTTLLRLIAGRLEPDEGSVRHGETVAVGWYGQELAALPPRADVAGGGGSRPPTVLDAVKEVVLETNTVEGIRLSAAQLLERFQFSAEAQKAQVSELSGGERRRLELLRVLAQAPNLLLLDEPTNDLDLDTLAVLEEELDRWEGAVVVATHDRFFLDRVCHDLFSVTPDGSVRHHPGGWAQYREDLESRRERERAASRARVEAREGQVVAGPRSDAGRRRKLAYHERRELQQLERRLPALEARREELNAALAAGADDYERAARLGEELARVLQEIDAAEARWLALAEIEEGV